MPAATAAPGKIVSLNQTITTDAEASAQSESLDGLIQVDSDIQPGDSGGPLYNAKNEVIGIDTAASTGGTQTSGYAIPIGDALKIADQITAGEESETISLGYPAFLGVELSSEDSDGQGPDGRGSDGQGSDGRGSDGQGQGSEGAAFGSSAPAAEGGTASGADVAGVVPGTPADQAGIAAGDTITAVGGKSVSSAQDLTAALAAHKPEDSVKVSWTDASGASHAKTVKLIEGPAA